MFTIEQIKAAHAKVKSGADFPRYIEDIRQLGVIWYETYVTDGHTDLYGTDGYKATREGQHGQKVIADIVNKEQFQEDLKMHQQGGSSYPAFLEQCAKYGIEKWEVSLEEMTCSYYDKTGATVLVEMIPGS